MARKPDCLTGGNARLSRLSLLLRQLRLWVNGQGQKHMSFGSSCAAEKVGKEPDADQPKPA
jgi:hypothetical protein